MKNGNTAIFDDYGYFQGTIPAEAVHDMTQPGPVDDAVEYWRDRLNFEVPRELAIHYLREFGAWDHDDLTAMDDTDLARIVLWIAAGDIRENGEWFGLIH